MARIACSKLGRQLAWQFLQANKEMIRTRYQGFALGRLVKDVLHDFSSKAKVREFGTFFEENAFPGAERSVEQVIEGVTINSDWIERDTRDVVSYLNNLQ